MNVAVRLLGAALAMTVATTPSPSFAQSNTCARFWIAGFFSPQVINNHHGLSRSSFGNISGDAFWPSEVVEAYARSTEGYIYMDTTNLQIYMHAAETTNTYTSWGPTAEALQRYTGFTTTLLGQNQMYANWPTSVTEHMDIRSRGPTDSVARTTTNINNGLVTAATFFSQSCVFPAFSGILGGTAETIVFSHELGHGYGYDHFDAWLTTMGTNYTGVVNCELGTAPSAARSMFVVPAASEHQCHDLTYGIYDGVDLGITPIYATGPSGNLAPTIDFQPVATIAASATTFTVPNAPLRFTTFSNRDTHVGYVTIQAFLSPNNRILDASDSDLTAALVTPSGWTAGDTTTRALSAITFNPQIEMPLVGTTYNLLIVVDPANWVAETRETNNVTDTGLSFRRL